MHQPEHFREEWVKCPYCSYLHSEHYEYFLEYDGDEGMAICANCHEEFEYVFNVDHSFCSYRKLCSIEEHKMETSSRGPYRYKDKNWTIWVCKKCNFEIIKTGPEMDEPYVIPYEKKDLK